MTTQQTYLTAADIDAGDSLQTDINGRDFIQWTTDTNVFVQAGAGSGKTTTLIQRILTLIIDDGLKIDQLAAITFTEAAGGKLVSNLRAALTQVAREAKHTPFPGTETIFRKVTDDAEVKRRAQSALEGLPGAAIGTLHSFCLRLLKQYPLQAGLPPKVDKVDELRQQMDASLRVDHVLETLTQLVTGEPEAVDTVHRLKDKFGLDIDPESITKDLETLIGEGVRMSALGDVARWMDEHWGDLGPTLQEPRWTAGDDAKLVREEFEFLRALDAAAAAIPAGDKLRVVLDEYLEEIQPYADGEASEVERVLWKPNLSSPRRYGGKNAWAKMDVSQSFADELENRGIEVDHDNPKNTAAAALKNVHTRFINRGKPGLIEAITHITPLLAALVLDAKDARLKRGTLEYHDMIFLAKQLVTAPENDRIREELHNTYRVIFVDEFQDTDPVQYEIVRVIAAGRLNASPVPGSLFMVGDPKQSIYRFRNADIDNYNAVKDSYQQDGSEEGVLVNLTQNFRSSERVVGAINALFAKVFSEVDTTPGAPTQASYEDMLPQKAKTAQLSDGTTATLPGKVVFIHSEEAAASSAAADRKIAEEDDIVAIIRAAVSNAGGEYFSHKPVEETDGDGTAVARPLAYSDIAILVHTHADSRRIQRALKRADIPYVSEGSTRLFLVPEINDLLTVLRAIGDPADAFTQIAALRTALLGCSDAELAADAKGEPISDRVANQRAWLKEKRATDGATDVGTLVRSIAAEFNLADSYIAQGKEDALGSLEQLLTLADQFARVTGLGLREFVRWADEQSETNNGAADPVLDNNADGVRIMTIHRSKGLEFPMVIVANLSQDYRTPSLAQGFSKDGKGVAKLQISNIQSPGYEPLKAYEAQAGSDELKRLMYVALTRAESVLAVPLHVGKTSNGSWRKTKGTALMEAMQEVLDEAQGKGSTEALAAAGITLVSRESLGNFDNVVLPAPARPEYAELTGREKAHEQAQKLLTTAAGTAPRIGVTTIAHAADQQAERAQKNQSPEDTSARTHAAKNEPPTPQSRTGEVVRAQFQEAGWTVPDSARDVNANVTRNTTGTDFGSAVHEVMERLPNAGERAIEELARLAVEQFNLKDEAYADVLATARAFADSAPYKAAVAADQAHFELPVLRGIPLTETAPDIAVNGYIDLLYKDGDSWVIADYKTDAYATKERVTSYFMQLELYARTLSEALGVPVSRLELIFLDGNSSNLATQVLTHDREEQ